MNKKSSPYENIMELLYHASVNRGKACAASGLTVEGQLPGYLVYPLLLQVDARRVGVLINRKLHRGLRVSRIVSEVWAEREGLLGCPLS